MRFHYNGYLGTWSRVLYEDNGHYVEVSLTCLPGKDEWDKISSVWIRAHSTPRYPLDLDANTLPPEAVNAMFMHLGEDKTMVLITYNFLPNIDWHKYDEVTNNGAPFGLIMEHK